MSKQKRLFLDIKFISGNLKGLTLDNYYCYSFPEQNYIKEINFWEEAIVTKRPIGYPKYVVLNYEITD